MLTISNIGEAIKFLSESTDRAWSEAEFFDAATNLHVKLHAPVPENVATSIHGLEPGKGLVVKHELGRGHSLLAVLFPIHVARLLISGEATTIHPHDYDSIPDSYKFLTEPVRVTRADIRIREKELNALLSGWQAAQIGEVPGAPRWMTNQPQVKVELGAAGDTAPSLMAKIRHKLRRNSLDGPIEKAIKAAESDVLAVVYLKLKEMALNQEQPFTGEIDGDALCYTTDQNKPSKLTKAALRKRIRTLVSCSVKGG